MINTYRLYSLALESYINVTYQDGRLKAFEAEDPQFNIEDPRLGRYALFYTEHEFVEAAQKHKVAMTSVQTEITYAMFYAKYDYKVAKAEGEKAWRKLSKADQVDAYYYIPAYEAFRKSNQHNKLYPASYLNARRWVK